jgi:hypothetical protein
MRSSSSSTRSPLPAAAVGGIGVASTSLGAARATTHRLHRRRDPHGLPAVADDRGQVRAAAGGLGRPDPPAGQCPRLRCPRTAAQECRPVAGRGGAARAGGAVRSGSRQGRRGRGCGQGLAAFGLQRVGFAAPAVRGAARPGHSGPCGTALQPRAQRPSESRLRAGVPGMRPARRRARLARRPLGSTTRTPACACWRRLTANRSASASAPRSGGDSSN